MSRGSSIAVARIVRFAAPVIAAMALAPANAPALPLGNTTALAPATNALVPATTTALAPAITTVSAVQQFAWGTAIPISTRAPAWFTPRLYRQVVAAGTRGVPRASIKW